MFFWKCSGSVIWPLSYVWTSLMNGIWHNCQNMVQHNQIVHGPNMFDHGLTMMSHSLSNRFEHLLNMFLEVFWEYIVAIWTWFRHHRTWTVYGTIVKTCSTMFWQGFWLRDWSRSRGTGSPLFRAHKGILDLRVVSDDKSPAIKGQSLL